MFAALGITAVIEKATPHAPGRRMVPASQAVQARGLNGLGCVNPPR
jgi:hypothetical protein